MGDEPTYPAVPPTAPAAVPPTSPWAPPPPDAAPPPPPSRLPSRALAVAIGVVALCGGTAFAVQALGGDDRGAATPEEAGEALAAAVADEDVLGVVDLLPDGERDLLRDVVTDARDEYQRLGVLSDEFRLDGFPGLDVTIDDLELDVEEITDGDGPDDGLAMVSVIGGDVTVAVDGDKLEGNLGEVVTAVADERDLEIDVDDAEEDLEADEFGFSFAVVEEDGRWHPSLLFSLAELARQSAEDLDEPDFDEGVEPAGASGPEEAVQALLDAGADLDAEAAIALLDPGEARALQVYSQFFLPIEADTDDVEITAELTDAEVDDLGGGASRVVPTGFEVRVEADGGTAEIVLDDGCTGIDIQPPPGEGEPFQEEFCFGDDVTEILPDELGDIEVPEELQEVAEAFLPLRFGIVTVERDGEHFVSPARTLADVLIGITRGLEAEDLQEGGAVFALLAGDLDEEVEDLLDEVFDSALAFEDTGGLVDEELGFEPDEDCEGVGCGFGEEPGSEPRAPTGASGPGGELLVFDVVDGQLGPGRTATFRAVAEVDGDFLIGAQGDDGLDTTIAVVDVASGELLEENDDFFGRDPEVLVTLGAGQVVEITVAGFSSTDAGSFIVYFEPF
jgi:hypothetical protein